MKGYIIFNVIILWGHQWSLSRSLVIIVGLYTPIEVTLWHLSLVFWFLIPMGIFSYNSDNWRLQFQLHFEHMTFIMWFLKPFTCIFLPSSLFLKLQALKKSSHCLNLKPIHSGMIKFYTAVLNLEACVL